MRILSGMRPTGKLHLGNYIGALKNWISFQDKYECFYFVADWHALTTDYEHPENIFNNMIEMVTDWLACGIDPDKSTIFVQSMVKEHAELHLLLSMITPVSWLERNPTYKEIRHELKDRELATYGFLGYPVLQSADILIYKANYVPVGVDQLPHIELTREIARRFNYIYGETFPEPEPILSNVPKICGIDGRKMSKSYNNAVFLSDSEEEIWEKIRVMVTDTRRKRRTDPGEPNDCPVFTLHSAFTDSSEREEIVEGCRSASIGCIDCKKILLEAIVDKLRPIREKRKELEGRKDFILDVLVEGSRRAREVASLTLAEVLDKMGFHKLAKIEYK